MCLQGGEGLPKIWNQWRIKQNVLCCEPDPYLPVNLFIFYHVTVFWMLTALDILPSHREIICQEPDLGMSSHLLVTRSDVLYNKKTLSCSSALGYCHFGYLCHLDQISDTDHLYCQRKSNLSLYHKRLERPSKAIAARNFNSNSMNLIHTKWWKTQETRHQKIGWCLWPSLSKDLNRRESKFRNPLLTHLDSIGVAKETLYQLHVPPPTTFPIY